MKEYTVQYSNKDKTIVGSFVRNYPEPEDLGLDEDIAEQMSVYWAAFRQWLVTDRATAKRLRAGNDSNPPRTEAEVAKYFLTAKMPVYKEPTEGLSAEEKVEKLIADLSPDAIRRLLEKAGITRA